MATNWVVEVEKLAYRWKQFLGVRMWEMSEVSRSSFIVSTSVMCCALYLRLLGLSGSSWNGIWVFPFVSFWTQSLALYLYVIDYFWKFDFGWRYCDLGSRGPLWRGMWGAITLFPTCPLFSQLGASQASQAVSVIPTFGTYVKSTISPQAPGLA